MKYHQFKGQSLVEIIVAFGLASVFLPAILVGLTSSREGRVQQQKRLDATSLIKETIESVRSVRESGWEFLVNGDYHPEIQSSNWVFVPGEDVVGDFTRLITVANAYRDENGNLVIIGGQEDPSTKSITINVSWDNIFPSSITTTFYIVRYLDNATYVETLESDFEKGILDGVVITTIDDGEVQLASGGSASWCNPNLNLSPLDLPKQGVANAINAIEGRAFAGTGENASGVSFANVLIDNNNPPSALIDGTMDGFKTNDVFGESDYAYLATDNNGKEVAIIDLTLPYSELGYFNAPGPGNADSIYVLGNVGFTTVDDTLYSFDLSAKTGSRPALDADGVSLAGKGTDIVVVGNYVYVSIDSPSTQMQIIDATNASNLSVLENITVAGSTGRSLFVNDTQTRAFLATKGSDQAELFILDISNKTSVNNVGSYEANGMDPKAVTVVPGNRAILVGSGGEEYQVIDVTNEASPARCGGLEVDSGVNGISSVIESDGDVFSYIITGDAGAEFRIIEGGPGGGFSVVGTFESQPIDMGSSAAINRIVSTLTEPNLTSVKFQIAIADFGPTDCTDAVYVFVGPDGLETSFFEEFGVVPFDNDGANYENPGRCVKYKALFDSQDPISSPIFSDITINYSP